MTDRHTVDTITDDALDALYKRLRKADRAEAAIERVRALHRPVEYRDRGVICTECSGYDGRTCDNSPCGYEHCPTLAALDEPGPAATEATD